MTDEATPANATPPAPSGDEVQRPWESHTITAALALPAICLIPGAKVWVAANLEGVLSLWAILVIVLRTYSKTPITWIK